MIGVPSSRLSTAALYELLGKLDDPPPGAAGEALETNRQEWRPEKRRLVALAGPGED